MAHRRPASRRRQHDLDLSGFLTSRLHHRPRGRVTPVIGDDEENQAHPDRRPDRLRSSAAGIVNAAAGLISTCRASARQRGRLRERPCMAAPRGRLGALPWTRPRPPAIFAVAYVHWPGWCGAHHRSCGRQISTTAGWPLAGIHCWLRFAGLAYAVRGACCCALHDPSEAASLTGRSCAPGLAAAGA